MNISLVLFAVLLFASASIVYQNVDAAVMKKCNDCTPPTLGVDEKNNRIVKDGITYNDKKMDVQNYFTPYPKLDVEIGKENVAKFKIYDERGPDNIAHFELAFGLAKGQTLQDSKARIEWDRTLFNEKKVTVFDPDNVLDKVTIKNGVEKCGTGKNECLILIVYHTFRENLEYDVFATNVWDHHRNAWQNYYNHGIHITGKSLNPPKTFDAIDDGQIHHLIKTGKNTSIDEFGDTWTFDREWTKDIKMIRPPTELLNLEKIKALEILGKSNSTDVFGYKRIDPEFEKYQNQYNLKNEQLFKTLFPNVRSVQFEEINNIKTITPKEYDTKDFKFILAMKKEAERASKVESLKSKYPYGIGD